MAHLKKSCVALACRFTLPHVAVAQTSSRSDPPSVAQSDARLSLGLGVVVWDSPYAGEGKKTLPLPMIRYDGERFFFRGLTGGVHLLRNSQFGLDAIGTLRMTGIDAKDVGRYELARNGINRDLLENRKDGLDMGLAASWRGAAGEVEMIAKADVTGASQGYELSVNYRYAFEIGRGALTPSVAVSYLSRDMANYYYGTMKEEVARGVVDYKPGAAIIPKIALSYSHPMGQHWRLTTAVQYQLLPSKLTDSPLLKSDAKGETNVMFGISRSF